MAKKWQEIEVIEGKLWGKGNTFIRVFTSNEGQIILRINKGSLDTDKPPIKTMLEKKFDNIDQAEDYAQKYMEVH